MSGLFVGIVCLGLAIANGIPAVYLAFNGHLALPALLMANFFFLGCLLQFRVFG